VKIAVSEAAIERFTQNFCLETRNDMKLAVKYMKGKEVDFCLSIFRAVERERVNRRVRDWDGEGGLVTR